MTEALWNSEAFGCDIIGMQVWYRDVQMLHRLGHRGFPFCSSALKTGNERKSMGRSPRPRRIRRRSLVLQRVLSSGVTVGTDATSDTTLPCVGRIIRPTYATYEEVDCRSKREPFGTDAGL